MKKTLLTILVAIIVNITFGQSVNFGIKAGVNISNESIKLFKAGPDLVNGSFIGVHIGGLMDIGVGHLAIQPGLYFSTKSNNSNGLASSQNQEFAGNFATEAKLYYLEMPVNLVYKLDVTPMVKIYMGGGPHLGYGLSGKYHSTNSEQGVVINSNDSYYKTADYGINFIAGVELPRHVLIDVSYDIGLGNMSQASETKINDKVFGISVGYMFR